MLPVVSRAFWRRRLFDYLLLAFILLVAASFRFYGLTTWDADTHQHPDERFLTIVGTAVRTPDSVAEYFASQRSSINPYAQGFNQYAYGQLPLTLTRFFAEKLNRTGFDEINLLGRALSALGDLGSIIFTWLLARSVFGRRHAHLAAALLAFSVLDIQLSHFFAVDTFVAFFAAGALFFGQRAWQRQSLWNAAISGAFVGCAAACKVSAFTLLPVLLLTFLWPPRPGRGSRFPWTRASLTDGATLSGVTLLTAFVAFRLAEPYAFAGPGVLDLRLSSQWISDKLYWAAISSGSIEVPYMIQWAGTPPYVFVLRDVVMWGLGPAFGLSALAGLVIALVRFTRLNGRERQALLVLGWALLNIAYFGAQYAKFLRYLLPAYFSFAIFAAYALLLVPELLGLLRDTLPRGYRLLRLWTSLATRAAPLVAPLVLLATALWAFAFTSIYAQPHSRIQASDWIYSNISPGKTLAVEHWDDRLPLSIHGHDPNIYRYIELTLYDPDNAAKRDRLIASLDQTDYIVLASRRLRDSIPHLPDRYPLAIAYYTYLESGQLGFQRVAHTEVDPHLGPWVIDDHLAQEDFTVYDHPEVQVYAKTPAYSGSAVSALLNAVPLPAAQARGAESLSDSGLILTPAELQAARDGGTWSQLFQRYDFANTFAIPVWLITAEIIALASFPLLWRALPRLPDRGFGSSKIIGLACVAFLAWLFASARLIPFGRLSLVLALVLVAVTSLLSLRGRARLFRNWVRSESRLLLTTEAIFLAGFALFLWLRAANPDLWHPVFGGEKPMNFAYLNAVVKSTYFPPYDPWFAGGIINYYYFGFVLVAALVRLTGIVPATAFNLAEPLLYGAVCAGAFSFAFSLSLATHKRVSRISAYLGGIAAVLLLAVLGNLDAGLQVLDQLSRLGAAIDPGSTGLFRYAAGLLAVLQGARFPPLDFWHSTRFIGPEDVAPIHEFPYFTFLYGDLHAHQIALPLTLAVLTVSINLIRVLRTARYGLALASVCLLAFLVGILRMTNTWDQPTYIGVAVLALGLGVLPGLLALRVRVALVAGVGVVLLLLLSQAVAAPFLARYALFYTGVDPIKANTALTQYLTIHGLLLFASGSLVAQRALVWLRSSPQEGAAGEESTNPPRSEVLRRLRNLVALESPPSCAFVGGLFLACVFALAGYPTRAFILFGAGIALAAALRQWRNSSRSFQAWLMATGLLITLVPEFIALKGDIGRMNTVFKLYFQAWTLFSVCGGVAIGWLVARQKTLPLPRAYTLPWLLIGVVLFSSAAAYPLLATQGKVGTRFADLPLTLDGMAFMDHAAYRDRDRDLNLPGDAQAIRWLQDNVIGSPVILEGRSPVYHWGSRVSIYTGLPTVLGWDVHESQQRVPYVAQIDERAADVQRAYDSSSAGDALEVIQKYGVRWVYIGGLERAYYRPEGLAKFTQMAALHLTYDRDGVQIFEVVR